MDYEAFKRRLLCGISRYDVSVDDAGIDKLYIYFQELKRWSARINLIAKETGDQVIVEKHFIDSLVLLTLLDDKTDYLLDVGSGAGLPGLVCKIAKPELNVDLLEPRMKRVSFLRHVVRTCRLDGIDVLSNRLEQGSRLGSEEKYTCVIGRAVADIGQFLSMCDRFAKSGVRVVCMKGPKFRQELDEAAGTITNWKLTFLKEYNLPFSGSSRALLVFEGEGQDR